MSTLVLPVNLFKSVFESEKEENAYVLGPDKFTQENLYDGKMGQTVFDATLKSVFKARDGYYIKCDHSKTQKEYCCGYGMDSIVQDKKDSYKALTAFEVKNLSYQDRPYGTDFVRRHVLPRAEGLDCLKVLVITYKKLLTKAAIELLSQEGWTILEIGERLTYEFFKNLKKLYSLAAKIKKAIAPAQFKPIELTSLKSQKPKRASFLDSLMCDNIECDNKVVCSNSIVSEYSNTLSLNLNSNELTNITKPLIHDTPLELTIIDSEIWTIIREPLELLSSGYNI